MSPDAQRRMDVYQEGQRAFSTGATCPYTDWRAGTWAKGRTAAEEWHADVAAEHRKPPDPFAVRGSTMNEAFEDAIWSYYQNLKAHGWSDPDEGSDTNSREALFWKTPAGKYGVASIAAAWWGWQMHAAHAAVSNEPPVQDFYIGGKKIGSGRLYGITPEQANRVAGGPLCVPAGSKIEPAEPQQDALLTALRETQEACNVSQCPWRMFARAT